MKQVKRRFAVMLLALAMVVTSVAPLAVATPTYAASAGISVTNLPAKTLTVKPGKSFTLKTSAGAKFKSSDTSLVKVSSKGKITAGKKAGTATITVTSKKNKKKSVKILVTVGKPVTKLTANSKTFNLTTGDTATLSATAKPADAANTDVIWTSSDDSIVKVNAKGVATAKAEGKATITGVAADGSGKKTAVTITVAPKSPLSLDTSKLTMLGGEKEKVTATVANKKAKLTWTSSDKKVATVDKKGNIKAVKSGSATITVVAKVGSEVVGTASVKVTVLKGVKSVEVLDPSTVKVTLTEADDTLTAESFTVSSDSSIAGVFRNKYTVEKMEVSKDAKVYTLSLKKNKTIGDGVMVQVAIAGYKSEPGTVYYDNSVELRTTADQYFYFYEGQKLGDNDFEILDSIGDTTIEGLPEGLTTRRVGSYIRVYGEIKTSTAFDVTVTSYDNKKDKTVTVWHFIPRGTILRFASSDSNYTNYVTFDKFAQEGAYKYGSLSAPTVYNKYGEDSDEWDDYLIYSWDNITYEPIAESVYDEDTYSYKLNVKAFDKFKAEKYTRSYRNEKDEWVEYETDGRSIYGYFKTPGVYTATVTVKDARDASIAPISQTMTLVVSAYGTQQAGKVLVSGYIKDLNGNPVYNAYVNINNSKYYTNAKDSHSYGAHTDANGYYFINADAGKYDMRASYTDVNAAGGIERIYDTIERIYAIDVAANTQQDFTLNVYGISIDTAFGEYFETEYDGFDTWTDQNNDHHSAVVGTTTYNVEKKNPETTYTRKLYLEPGTYTLTSSWGIYNATIEVTAEAGVTSAPVKFELQEGIKLSNDMKTTIKFDGKSGYEYGYFVTFVPEKTGYYNFGLEYETKEEDPKHEVCFMHSFAYTIDSEGKVDCVLTHNSENSRKFVAGQTYIIELYGDNDWSEPKKFAGETPVTVKAFEYTKSTEN